MNFMRKVQSGQTRAWDYVAFVAEIATSAFTGVITFYLCERTGLDPLTTAALVGISGHMGSRALVMFESVLRARFPQQ